MSRTVDHIDINDVISLAAHQRRQETMQAVEIRQRQKHLAPESFQTATGVAGAVMQDRVAHGIGDARLNLLETGILATDPLAGGKARAFTALFDSRNQRRQESRIILPVAIKRCHDRAMRYADAAAHCGRLSARSRMTYLAQIAAAFHGGGKPLGRCVR